MILIPFENKISLKYYFLKIVFVSIKMNYRVLFISASSFSSLFKLLGFLCTLEDNDYISSVDTYCGVGFASLVTTLLCLKFTIREITSLLANLSVCNKYNNDYKLDFTSLSKDSLSKVSFQEEISKKMLEKILEKYDDVPTLSELYVKTGLSIIFPVFNFTKNEIEYINPKEHTHFNLLQSCDMSIFNPYSKGGYIFEGERFASCTLADRYPIEYFLKDSNEKNNILGIFCEVDTCSRNSFMKSITFDSNNVHYILNRIRINESSLSDEGIGKSIAEGYSKDISDSFKFCEFKTYKYPK